MTLIPSIERASEAQILEEQIVRVRKVLKYVLSNSKFYQQKFKNSRFDADKITIDEFLSLPTTTKDDLQNFNWEFLCVPRSKVAEYTSTSGTMGKPVTIALTESDVQRLAYNEAISFACADGTENDLYQLMLTLDRQFMAGIAYYEGIRKLGAGLIRVGPGLPALQWETIQRLQPTTLVAVPSFIVKLIEYAEQHNLDLNASSVKKAICIGESIRTEDLKLSKLGKRITDTWRIKLYGTYASTEMQTAFTECSHGQGGHLHPELIYLELLDEQGKPVPPDVEGEITITTLGVEGMPLIRYRTGDVARALKGACACGRSTMRLGPIIGRKQQMIKLKGTTLYPPALFDLLNVEGVSDYAVEAFTGSLGTDELKLYVHAGMDEMRVAKELSTAFQARLRVVPQMIFVSQNEIEKIHHTGNARKLRKFIDNRK